MIRPLLVFLVACTERVSNYEITLVPHLVSEDALVGGSDAKLVLRLPDGTEHITDLGAATTGDVVEAPHLPPLPIGSAVGLAFGSFNPSDPDGWSRQATVAYGEVMLEEELGVNRAERQFDIVVLPVDRVTRLGKLADAQRRVGGAAAMTPDRQIYVFGGGDPDASDSDGFGVGRNTVYHVAASVEGWAGGSPLDAKLPSYDSGGLAVGETEDLSSASAVYAETADGPRIFVFGGRPSLFNTGGSTSRVLEFDPTTESFVDASITLNYTRSAMLAVPVGSNKVVLYGGFIAAGIPNVPILEIFTIGSRSADILIPSDPILGNYGGYGAPFGNAAAICAGGSLLGDTLTPVDQCFVIGANGSFDALAALPEPLFAASLAELPDGGLLVTGGTSEILDMDEADPDRPSSIDASRRAYRLDEGADEWVAVGDLVHARAHHRSVALGDGRVLIVGGTEQAAFLYASTGPAVLEAEIFDPFTETFAVTGSNAAGSGQDPEVVGPPNGPWAVLEGGTEEGTYVGGAAFGVIGAIPPEG